MSNPVPPPGGNFPPAGPQGQPGFPQQGYPQQGQPQGYPQQGQGYPQDGQQGFPPAAFPPAEIPTPKKSGRGKAIVIRLVIALVVIIVGLVLKATIWGDKTADAKVGDCIAAPTQDTDDAKAKVVKCSDSSAAYTVVARVNGQSDVNSKACDQYFKPGDKYSVLGMDGDNNDKYLLCLKPNS